ncbi:MAG: hypothetical protein AVDCRST_MAG96-1097 [uncultured Segetibacter sp.]|uniref:Uncharacterized protein n=1 Tax=uncultured Segetibacter sp. TaxID=481133 RepID=A0A6J4S1B3_9BACT|nr:MAG: hypothetical protein AVDCRST_MAG96-1097 [uncultured Segetibacter sp.]
MIQELILRDRSIYKRVSHLFILGINKTIHFFVDKLYFLKNL